MVAALGEARRHPLVVTATTGDLDGIDILTPATDADHRAFALEEAVRARQDAAVDALLARGVVVSPYALQAGLRTPPLLGRLLAAAPDEETVAAAFASAVLADDHEAVDVFIDAGRLPDDSRAIVLRLGSDGMRKRWGIRARRRR